MNTKKSLLGLELQTTFLYQAHSKKTNLPFFTEKEVSLIFKFVGLNQELLGGKVRKDGGLEVKEVPLDADRSWGTGVG